MSCENATSPINIVTQNAEICDLKCEYQPSYTTTTISATNKGEYIRYSFAPSNKPPVVFNGDQYNVSDMKIFQPSLHTYNGAQVDGEIIIVHSNISQNGDLLVCIPIKSGGSSSGIGDSIINQVASKAPSADNSTNISLSNFSLSNILPKTAFYSYKGTLPYLPCNSNVEIIVYESAGALTVQSSTITNLKRIIQPNSYETHTNPDGYYYNKKGATKSSDGDDIYIECNPTGSEGETIVSVDSSDDTDWATSYISQIMSGPALGVLIALVVGVTLYFVGKKMYKWVGQNNQNNSMGGMWSGMGMGGMGMGRSYTDY